MPPESAAAPVKQAVTHAAHPSCLGLRDLRRSRLRLRVTHGFCVAGRRRARERAIPQNSIPTANCLQQIRLASVLVEGCAVQTCIPCLACRGGGGGEIFAIQAWSMSGPLARPWPPPHRTPICGPSAKLAAKARTHGSSGPTPPQGILHPILILNRCYVQACASALPGHAGRLGLDSSVSARHLGKAADFPPCTLHLPDRNGGADLS